MTEVLLMADVKKLGKAGEIKKVAPGYARNMLIPQGLAAPVTEASRRRLAKLEEARAKARAEAKKAAEAVASKLGGLTVKVSANVKPDSKELYGSVSAAAIIAAIAQDRGVSLERGQLDLPDHLRQVGEYKAMIDLGEGVKAPCLIVIEGTAGEA